jgi:hypothetical protein
MSKLRVLLAVFVSVISIHRSRAEDAAPLSAMARMPVKEITVFKDGHALLLHEGKMPTDGDGNVVLDYLPAPVLGTFWPYSTDKNVKLTSVVAGQRRVSVDRTALNLRDLIEANIGAPVLVTEIPVAGKESSPSAPYEATIVAIPAQSGKELTATSPPNTGEHLPVKGNVVILKTGTGDKVVNIDRIQDITFKGDHKPALANEEFRNLLTLKLAWPDNKPDKEADVGMLYLQKGIRWIPNYKVSIDGQGSATVKLQATLINELTDLEDVSAHLVIGVPQFAFSETVDPISLQQQIAQLGQYFEPNGRVSNGLSNAIMSQARFGEARSRADGAAAGAPVDLGPEVAGSNKSEDLFIFHVNHVSLKKGQRMVLPVTEFTLSYKDIYSLDLPFTPPPNVLQNFNGEQQTEIARMLKGPKVVHKIRLSNKSDYPLTTAPALILRDDRVLAQGLMTYTAVGADSDLEVTTAIDIKVKKSDRETKRAPNAANWQGNEYGRVDLAGKITLTSFAKQPVDVEVTRHILGNADSADNDGKTEMVNILEDDAGTATEARPMWWGWYSWPSWWFHFNGMGKITWTAHLEPSKPLDLNYTWSYYWR